MEEEKDYLYYFWNNNKESWLKEFAYLEKEDNLKGLTPYGLTISKYRLNLNDFNLEELMCATDIIRCYFYSPSGKYYKFNERYSSYGLKHLIEQLLHKITKGRINYVSNGTLILAMYHVGYKFQQIPNTPNCLFNIPDKAYIRMENALENMVNKKLNQLH